MPRRRSPTLTDAELRIMETLWASGSGTVREVLERSRKGRRGRRPAYGSVSTILRILEEKGYVRHHKDGRAFIYEATVGPEEARGEAVEFVVSRFFRNSRALLALNLLEDQGVDAAEIERLRKLIDEKGEDA